nr:thioesterase family protein [Bacillus sp. FJAT-45037]
MRLPTYITNFEQWREGFTFSTTLKVRFSETDAFGHVNNKNALVYFEDARLEYFNSIGLMQKWSSEDFETMIVAADLQVDYIRQIKFNETLHVFVKVEKLGNSSMDLHYLVENESSDICLTGRGSIVQIGKVSGRSVPWNEEMRQALQDQPQR